MDALPRHPNPGIELGEEAVQQIIIRVTNRINPMIKLAASLVWKQANADSSFTSHADFTHCLNENQGIFVR